MRQIVLVAMASIALGACGKADALAPDPANPAHCIAAFNYGAYWLSHKESYRPKVAVEIAKGIYEMSKVKASGQSVDAAKAESVRITESYSSDPDAMDELYNACSNALQDDEEFKRQLPTLLESAKPLAAKYRPKKV